MKIQKKLCRCLILVAHGSRRQNANEEVITLTRLLEQHMKQTSYDQIACGFVELATPSVNETAIHLINQADGQKLHIDLMPYFLSSGNHVEKDIPELAETLIHMPEVESCHQLDYIGKGQALLQFLLERMQKG